MRMLADWSITWHFIHTFHSNRWTSRLDINIFSTGTRIQPRQSTSKRNLTTLNCHPDNWSGHAFITCHPSGNISTLHHKSQKQITPQGRQLPTDNKHCYFSYTVTPGRYDSEHRHLHSNGCKDTSSESQEVEEEEEKRKRRTKTMKITKQLTMMALTCRDAGG